MDKKVLIVCPAPPACQAENSRKPVVSRFFRHTRLSLLAVAAASPADWEVEITDEYISPIDFSRDYDCVAVSFMTAGAPRAYEIAAVFRGRHIPVIAGGFHPSFMPDESLQHFDSVCIGDAEHVWPAMLKDLEQGHLKKIYRSDPDCALSHLPLPRRNLLNTTDYLTRNTVQTSRGCPHLCEFCSITAFHKGRYRHRPIPEILDEIKNLSGNLLIFIDDNIVTDRSYALSLFAELKKLRRQWFSQAEIKIAGDPELLEAAAASGCRGLFVGLESLSNENLQKVKKGFNRADEYYTSIETLHKAGIAVEVGFAFGFDDDHPDVFEKTSQFLKDSSTEVAQLTILTPFPGTPLYKKFLKSGRILTTDWKYYDFNHVVIRPLHMSPRELQEGVDGVINDFYSFRSIAKRIYSSLGYLGAGTTFKLVLPLSLAIRKRVTTWEKRSSTIDKGLNWLEEAG